MNKFDRNIPLYDVIYVLGINPSPIILLHRIARVKCFGECLSTMVIINEDRRREGTIRFVDFPIFMPLSGRVGVF